MIILTYGHGWGEENEILCPTRVVCSTIPRGGGRRWLGGRARPVGNDDVVVFVIFTTTFLFRGSGRRRRDFSSPPFPLKGRRKAYSVYAVVSVCSSGNDWKNDNVPRPANIRPTHDRPFLCSRYLRAAAVPIRSRVYRNARRFTPMTREFSLEEHQPQSNRSGPATTRNECRVPGFGLPTLTYSIHMCNTM